MGVVFVLLSALAMTSAVAELVVVTTNSLSSWTEPVEFTTVLYMYINSLCFSLEFYFSLSFILVFFSLHVGAKSPPA